MHSLLKGRIVKAWTYIYMYLCILVAATLLPGISIYLSFYTRDIEIYKYIEL